MTTTFRTKPENARALKWGQLAGVATWFTVLPLVDITTPELLTASLAMPGDSELALRPMGARLPTSAEIGLLKDKGFVTTPTTLPTQEMMPQRIPGEGATEYAVRCYAPMASIEWKRTHDQRAKAKLEKWDRVTPVCGMGKYPYRNGPNAPPPGRCYLRGWWVEGQYANRVWVPGHFIQEGVQDGTPGPHANGQFDYGSVTIGAFDGRTPPDVDPALFDRFMADVPATGLVGQAIGAVKDWLRNV